MKVFKRLELGLDRGTYQAGVECVARVLAPELRIVGGAGGCAKGAGVLRAGAGAPTCLEAEGGGGQRNARGLLWRLVKQTPTE